MAAPAAMCAERTVQNLSTSKQLLEPLPGGPVRLNSLPMGVAASPDGHYLAILNAGYGTYESQYAQSIALLDTKSGKLAGLPRTARAIEGGADVLPGHRFQRGQHASVREPGFAHRALRAASPTKRATPSLCTG